MKVASTALAVLLCAAFSSPAYGQGGVYYRYPQQNNTFTGPAGAGPTYGPGGTIYTGPAGAAPGGAYFGSPQPYYYQNRPGLGIYNGPVYRSGVPFVGAPILIGGGAYGIRAGGVDYRFWKSPSGFYYPWYGGAYAYQPIIITYQQGSQSPSAALPPISTVIRDMRDFMDQSNEKGKLNAADFQSLSQRLKDIENKDRSMRLHSGGTPDERDEADIRKDLDKLGEELSFRIKS